MFEDGKIAHQLPLAINLNDEATFSGFCWRGNEELQAQLLNILSGKDIPLFYLWGSTGSGKSHILQGCCQFVDTKNETSIYLPLRLLKEFGPQVLHGIDEHFLVCLDDIDAIAKDKAWEEELFHLYNRIKDSGKTILVISGNSSPNQTAIILPDLRSRLAWGLVWQIHELSDEDKINTLQSLAVKRGFKIPATVCHYLINRSARNMHDLHDLLNRLDEASLIAQRKITIPFVKSILKI